MVLKNVITLNVDLKRRNESSGHYIVQNDNVRFIIVVNDGGKPLSDGQLSKVDTVILASTRPDRKTVITEGQLLDNQIIFDIGSTEAERPGRVNAMVQMFDSEGRVSSLSFAYSVVADPTGDGYIPSEQDKTFIEIVLGDGPLVIEGARSATVAASEAAAYADNVRRDTERVRDETEEIRTDLLSVMTEENEEWVI